MENNRQKMVINFHNGREKAIDIERLIEFEDRCVLTLLFRGEDEWDAKTVLEELGPYGIDFSNVILQWSEAIPDIHPHSTRLFTIWAENTETGDVVGLVRGFFMLAPFSSTGGSKEYYSLHEHIPYYPLACISSFRTTLKEKEALDDFLTQLLEAISQNWQQIRRDTISRLPEGSSLWRRFVLSFEEIIHFSFLCPSIDREVIETLKRRNYRGTGVMQLFASTSPFYDQAAINHHLQRAHQILNKSEKDNQT
ncbi:MAG: hypothetical protein ACXAEI_09400 [Candidatus Hodarchaeales archaeon]